MPLPSKYTFPSTFHMHTDIYSYMNIYGVEKDFEVPVNQYKNKKISDVMCPFYRAHYTIKGMTHHSRHGFSWWRFGKKCTKRNFSSSYPSFF
jgi:hypothetical protein